MDTYSLHESLLCPICSLKYDKRERVPKYMPNCQHIICKVCLQEKFEKANSNSCSICQEQFPEHSILDINDFKTNHFILKILEEIETMTSCSIHKIGMNLFCMDEGKQICQNCHDIWHKNHKVMEIMDIKDKANRKIQDLKFEKESLNKHLNMLHEFFTEDKKTSLRLVTHEFSKMRELINQKEREIYLDVEEFYKKSENLALSSRNNLKEIIKNIDEMISNLQQPSLTPSKVMALKTEYNSSILENEFTNEKNQTLEFIKIIKFQLEEMFINLFMLLKLQNEELDLLFNHISNSEYGKLIRGEDFELKIEAKTEESVKKEMVVLDRLNDSKICELIKSVSLNLRPDVNHVLLKNILLKLPKNLIKIEKIKINFDTYTLVADSLFSYLTELTQNSPHSLTHFELNSRNTHLFTGERLKIFNEMLQKGFTQLRSLHLKFSRTEITDGSLKELSESIGKSCTQLENLYLGFSFTDITDECLKVLAESIQRSCSQLRHLYLNLDGCKKVTDDGVKALSECIQNSCHQLESLLLNFSRAQVKDVGLRALSECIEKICFKLQELHLSFDYCKEVTDMEMKILSESIEKSCKKLQSLHLSCVDCYKITDNGVMAFTECIQQSSIKLQSLHLNFSNTQVTDKGMRALSESIETSCSQLKNLHLSFGYNITDEGFKILSQSIYKSCCQLQSFHLNFDSCWYITDEGVKVLSECIQKIYIQLQSLHLNFSHTQVKDEGVKSLTQSIQKNCTRLHSLHLSFYKCTTITDEEVEVLSESIRKNCCQLQNLYLNLSSTHVKGQA